MQQSKTWTMKAAASLWKQATEHFYNLGNPDKFFADRSASEWVSFTLTTKDHLLLNEIERVLQRKSLVTP